MIPNIPRIDNTLQKVTILQALDTMCVRIRSDGNNQFIIRDIEFFASTFSAFARDEDKFIGHVESEGYSLEVMSPTAIEDFTDWLKEGAGLEGTDCCTR